MNDKQLEKINDSCNGTCVVCDKCGGEAHREEREIASYMRDLDESGLDEMDFHDMYPNYLDE